MSFQEGPPTQIDSTYDGSSAAKRNTATGSGKPSKWQPLATVDPSPVAENDPFSLGDSDDEKDMKPKEQATVPGSEQIKKDTEEAMAGEIGSSKGTKSDEPSK